uniref:Uncharacterized protein n=1 Tax=Chlamydomonas leiostraca TaxID=1034604 RepID=A0A7S0R141_9CHLO
MHECCDSSSPPDHMHSNCKQPHFPCPTKAGNGTTSTASATSQAPSTQSNPTQPKQSQQAGYLAPSRGVVTVPPPAQHSRALLPCYHRVALHCCKARTTRATVTTYVTHVAVTAARCTWRT